MPSISVVTIVRNRQAHLINLLRGLETLTRPPDQVVVVVMGGEDPARHLPTSADLVYMNSDALPLAAARNAGAQRAVGDLLVFLDVDCIPGSRLIAAYGEVMQSTPALCMGQVRYLEEGSVRETWDDGSLAASSRPHPDRGLPEDGGPLRTDRYELFWSLSFAVMRATFNELGGFDVSFDGYGGEDTDFAFTARLHGVPLMWVPQAIAFHQFHTKQDPPVEHLRSIVENASRFRAKWGTWAMEGWLREFEIKGLIEWDPEGSYVSLRST